MRKLLAAPSQGALPPAFGSPRDICFQCERSSFQTGQNIPAGGSAVPHPRPAAEPGAQNSSFKNFAGRRARR